MHTKTNVFIQDNKKRMTTVCEAENKMVLPTWDFKTF